MGPALTAGLLAAIEELGEDEDEAYEDWRLVAKVEGDSGRWSTRWTMVVEDPKGRLWGVDYQIGLTENQEHEIPWVRVPEDRLIPVRRMWRHVKIQQVITYEGVPSVT
jgi:hypothetical protein